MNKPIDIQKKKAALDCIRKEGYASISLIRNALECRYQLAGQIVLWLENEGYIGTFDGAKHRKVLITDEQYETFIKKILQRVTKKLKKFLNFLINLTIYVKFIMV